MLARLPRCNLTPNNTIQSNATQFISTQSSILLLTGVLVHGDSGGHSVELLVALALDLDKVTTTLRVRGEHAYVQGEKVSYSSLKRIIIRSNQKGLIEEICLSGKRHMMCCKMYLQP